MNKINTNKNYRYGNVKGSNQQVGANNLPIAQENSYSIFARKVKVGAARVGAVGAACVAYNNSELLVKAMGDYAIASPLMPYGAALAAAVAGIASYATLFYVVPAVLDATMKFARFIYDSIKLVGFMYENMKAVLQVICLTAPYYILKSIVQKAIDSIKYLGDLIKLVYEWRGTVGLIAIAGLSAYYDLDSALDIMQWVYEHYDNFSKMGRLGIIPWTAKLLLQTASIMLMPLMMWGDGVDRVHGWLNNVANIMALMCRYEYEFPYRGMASMLGIAGVMTYYNSEMTCTVLEEIYQHSESALSELSNTAF